MTEKQQSILETNRKNIPTNSTCYICGCSCKNFKLRWHDNKTICEKHYQQLQKYNKITDSSCRKHKEDSILVCDICGERKHANLNNVNYCQKHYLQIIRYGKILNKTIYDKNEIVINDNFAEIILYDKNCNEVGKTKIDLEDLEKVKIYKIYMRLHGTKFYAAVSLNTKKILLHRFLLDLHNTKYTTDYVVDHINGDSLDNRKCNLRICTHNENMKNINKKNGFTGITFDKKKNKWIARIMFEYKGKQLGVFKTQAEALFSRIKAEKELFKEYGPNKDLFYIINHPSPIEELNRVILEGV